MKFGYFCNSTNWNNSKSFTQLLKEIRDGDNHSRRLAKLDNDLLKEIKDNLKK